MGRLMLHIAAIIVACVVGSLMISAMFELAGLPHWGAFGACFIWGMGCGAVGMTHLVEGM